MTPSRPRARNRAPISTAPRDGSLVRVAIRASEQGPAEFDTVRFAQSARSGEGGWLASDSDPEARIVYSDSELAYWIPLPGQEPAASPSPKEDASGGGDDEADGSGV
ncbi:MAG TPA: hypothetical protein VFB16_13105 [Bauldia sp.]|nr:hypothetical protein [Bauldia sp.]